MRRAGLSKMDFHCSSFPPKLFVFTQKICHQQDITSSSVKLFAPNCAYFFSSILRAFSELIMDNGLTKIVLQLFVLLHSAIIAQLINRQPFGLTFCHLIFCFEKTIFSSMFSLSNSYITCSLDMLLEKIYFQALFAFIISSSSFILLFCSKKNTFSSTFQFYN